jgi:hypothetical protein
MSERCGYPFAPSISEWVCGSSATHLVIGASGSGYYEKVMPRCNEHLGPTISAFWPSRNSDYPYNVLARVEMIPSNVMRPYAERQP